MIDKATIEHQRNKLNQAIDLAKDVGFCQYVRTGMHNGAFQSIPICVIGQLLVLEGLKPDDLFDFQGSLITISKMQSSEQPKGFQLIANYPIDLLVKLQMIWDGPRTVLGIDNENVSQIKLIMKQEVENTYNEN